MSAALDRILVSVIARSTQPDAYIMPTHPADWWSDASLAFGDWKDAIRSEFHTMRASLEEIAQACDENEMWGEGAKLRAIVKDL